MAGPCHRGVLSGRVARSLLFHPPQVDDLGHAGKVAHIMSENEMRRLIELCPSAWLA